MAPKTKVSMNMCQAGRCDSEALVLKLAEDKVVIKNELKEELLDVCMQFFCIFSLPLLYIRALILEAALKSCRIGADVIFFFELLLDLLNRNGIISSLFFNLVSVEIEIDMRARHLVSCERLGS